MTDHTQHRDAFRASASRLVAARYPHALGALLGGSAARGRATASSDLDVAVLLPDREHSGREVVRHEGRVAELFLNTVADLPEFFAWDRARRRGTVLFLYDRGLPLADPRTGPADAGVRAHAAQPKGAGVRPVHTDLLRGRPGLHGPHGRRDRRRPSHAPQAVVRRRPRPARGHASAERPARRAAVAEHVLGLLGGPLREGYGHRWKP
ncbi:nucleotidyltransferase domain-containing protein [Streptomyces alboflavus]|uniref:nucleotidyltransferase domain-containing protein n=1 Tax=Streptomyces alboflavus TaxID=67267 RepID=UPI001F28D72F|nr:nucleotidyltransferase domain-containing protein [Streptomyces alboflavus]